ncbi:hypothetical protein [Pedobacter gandavensis]|uniref:hypothetical protein n=1 Tax=Pedobacter gandavensis TaxID=2679963 RepID=UPI00292D4682|nr:hypothetical protein [Pedobacter gandavensis]
MVKTITIAILILFCVRHGSSAESMGCTGYKMSPEKTKYFVLEVNSKDYKTVHVKLNGDKIYGINLEIELYNLKYKQQSLILFSVLSSRSKPSWKPIRLHEITPNLIDFDSLKALLERRFSAYNNSGGYDTDQIKTQDIKLIIKRDDQYFIAENSLLEYFKIIEQDLVFPNSMGNAFINIKSPLITVKEFEDKYKLAYKENSPNAFVSKKISGNTSLLTPLQKPLLFMSGSSTLFGHQLYNFWQFNSWPYADSSNSQRGIDRFAYDPALGIIGGSFDAWISWNYRIDANVIHSNYIQEKIILPASIKDIVVYH